MKKLTAVEWLYSELSKNNISNDSIKSRIYKESEIWKQSLAMEKEQIMDAYFSAIKSTAEGWNGEYAQGNSPNIEEKFMEDFNKWFEQFKK
jgi:hypothetical protein